MTWLSRDTQVRSKRSSCYGDRVLLGRVGSNPTHGVAVAEGGTGEKRGDPWTRGEPCRLHGACTLVRAYGFVEFESHQQRL